jgi:hypothetical protein
VLLQGGFEGARGCFAHLGWFGEVGRANRASSGSIMSRVSQ